MLCDTTTQLNSTLCDFLPASRIQFGVNRPSKVGIPPAKTAVSGREASETAL